MKNLKKKSQRIKITTTSDLKAVLKNSNLEIDNTNNTISEFANIFKLTESIKNRINDSLNNDVCYVCNSIEEFIDYFYCLEEIDKYNIQLYETIKHINKLIIYRTEFERIITIKEDTEEIKKSISNIINNHTYKISDDELSKIDILETEINDSYLFAKDIELLKKIIMTNGELIKNDYNKEKQCRTVELIIPKSINLDYITVKKGSIEYYEHIKNNIPRMKRLISNLHKYLVPINDSKTDFLIEHSLSLQDSINIAVATFNGTTYKAISGKVDIDNYCVSPKLNNQIFAACQVNKLGLLGIGYRRVNDSEKKIFETIANDINLGSTSNKGNLTLFTKWEPCQSCYYVIYQFLNMYPNINVKIKYDKKYGL